MTWKGKINRKDLEDESLLKLITIVKQKDSILNIEIKDIHKDEFVQKAIKSIKYGKYIYLVKDKVMYTMFNNHMFKFSRGYPEMESAKKFGESQGISRKDMPFEILIEKPW